MLFLNIRMLKLHIVQVKRLHWFIKIKIALLFPVVCVSIVSLEIYTVFTNKSTLFVQVRWLENAVKNTSEIRIAHAINMCNKKNISNWIAPHINLQICNNGPSKMLMMENRMIYP